MTTLGRREKCLRNRSGKGHLRALRAHQMRKPAPPGAAGNSVDQNRLKPCRERSSGLYGVGIGESKRKSRFKGALSSPEFGRARKFQDALGGTLHGVTSEASGDSRWRAVPAKRAPPPQRREAERDLRLEPRDRAAKVAEPERLRAQRSVADGLGGPGRKSSPHPIAMPTRVARLIVNQCQLVSTCNMQPLQRDRLFEITASGKVESRAIVSVERHIVPRSADGYIELLAVNEFSGAERIDINDHAINRGALARVRGRGIAVVDVLQTSDCRADLAPVVDAHAQFAIVNGGDGRKLSIGDAKRTIWCAELNPVAGPEQAVLLMKDLDPGQARGMVTDGLSSFIPHHHLVPFRIDRLDLGITSAVETETRTPAPESEHVADFVTLRSSALRPGQLAVYEHDLFSPGGGDMPSFLERCADGGVQMAALVVGRADDEDPFTCFMRRKVFASNRWVTLIRIDDLTNAALLLEKRDCLADVSTRGKRDCLA